MKVTEESVITSVDIVNRSTGETIPMDAIHHIKNRYYSISKLRTKVDLMDLFTIMENVCNSSNDIRLFKLILDLSDNQNHIRISSQKMLAKRISTSTRTLQRTLKKMCDIRPERLLLKMDRGVYQINPFIFKSKRTTNATVEQLQAEWENLCEQNL